MRHGKIRAVPAALQIPATRAHGWTHWPLLFSLIRTCLLSFHAYHQPQVKRDLAATFELAVLWLILTAPGLPTI